MSDLRVCYYMWCVCCFFFSSRRRHTRCALVTGVQTCALPIYVAGTGFTVLDRVYADGGFAGEALGGSCGNVLVSLAMLHRHVAPLLALGMDNTAERPVSDLSPAAANTR